MQLYEDGRLDLSDTVGKWIQEVPEAWKEIEILQLLRHASGLPDYRFQQDFNPYRAWAFGELIDLVQALPLHFKPGTEVMQSATNFLLLTEIVERAGEQSYHDFVTKRQIQYLGLRHTGFAEDLGRFMHEDVSLTENVHQLFKKDRLYIDPTEPASYQNSQSLLLRSK